MVLVLIGLLGAAAVMGAGGVGASRLRGAATTVVAYSRVAVTRTNATGRPVRMVFDLEHGRIWLEESVTSRALRDNPNATNANGEKRSDSDYSGPDSHRARSAQAEGEAEAERFIEARVSSAQVSSPSRDWKLQVRIWANHAILGPASTITRSRPNTTPIHTPMVARTYTSGRAVKPSGPAYNYAAPARSQRV